MTDDPATKLGASRIDRPEIPAEYGAAKATDRLEWSRIEERLTSDRVYWIATVGTGGRPRVRPIDGVYVDCRIYVGGSPRARWVQEVGANPHVSIHLDGLDEIVIIDGEATILSSATEDLAVRLAAASALK